MKRILYTSLLLSGISSFAQASESRTSFAEYCAEALEDQAEMTTINALAKMVSIRTPVRAEYCEMLEQKLSTRPNLILKGKGLTSLKPLAYLPGTVVINAANNSIDSLEGLEGLTNLEHLDLSSNELSDLSGLKKLQALKVLRLAKNKISDVETIGMLKGLSDLSLAYNEIKDIEPLLSIKGLRYLNVSSNAIRSVKGLEKLSGLETLSIGFNQICDVDFLKHSLSKDVTLIGDDAQECVSNQSQDEVDADKTEAETES